MTTIYDIDELQKENEKLKKYLRDIVESAINDMEEEVPVWDYLVKNKLVVKNAFGYGYSVNEEIFE